MGNKTGITKERRGLIEESGTYTYGYDPLDRLESIRKDNVLETQYRYDAFGNRTKKESGEHQTSYWYKSLNQLINLTDQSQERTSSVKLRYTDIVASYNAKIHSFPIVMLRKICKWEDIGIEFKLTEEEVVSDEELGI